MPPCSEWKGSCATNRCNGLHVDSYVKGVHLKNITPIHVDVLFFKTHTLLFLFLFLKLLVIPGRYPPGYHGKKELNFFWSRSLPMLTDFYFSKEPLVLVLTIFL